ncbi:g-type lectin s-receptor-like serine/threonine-protein kinase lecrk1 [Quercus suber]|uniref:G-type lectin s-receptor-like serine/threonine-protein kinase lecrk1 n=1 Tax=Quercus suber TaxID=58331 RepID=A0AAW0JZ26_QUESU
MKRLERLVIVTIWCIQEDPSLRPSMKRVTQVLEGMKGVYLISTLAEKRVNVFRAINNERKET